MIARIIRIVLGTLLPVPLALILFGISLKPRTDLYEKLAILYCSIGVHSLFFTLIIEHILIGFRKGEKMMLLLTPLWGILWGGIIGLIATVPVSFLFLLPPHFLAYMGARIGGIVALILSLIRFFTIKEWERPI